MIVDRIETCDILIVGAGPAGSTAAYYLARDYPGKVLIVDRCGFPRHKACGGALARSKDWPAEFENFAAITEKLHKREIEDVVLSYGGETIHESHGTHVFDHINRYEFDDLLFKAALAGGRASFRKFAVRSIEKRTSGGRGRYVISDGDRSIEADFIIGADGVHSAVSRYLGNPPRAKKAYAVCLEYDIVCESKDRNARIFLLWGGELGYAWLFPSVDGYYIGLGCVAARKKKVRPHLDEFLKHVVDTGLMPREYGIRQTFGAPDPLTVPRHYCDDGVLLCGDAMGLVNQLSGEGIYYAMKSGKIAAACLTEKQGAPATAYRRAIRPTIRDVTVSRNALHVGFALSLSNLSFKAIRGRGLFGAGDALRKWFLNRFFKLYNLPADSRYRKL